MKELIYRRKWECSFFLIFVIFYSVIMMFHEPWFDEAQAWQIAKCASIKELLIDIPHYEGHPVLWYLILAIPARLGVSFEIGLKTIGFVISIISTVMILFYTNLPLLVRLMLPFSYFMFYQQGIIVRPYGVLALLMIALGIVLKERNIHPWVVFVLLLMLCLISAYGIVMAGGISICMVKDLWDEKGSKKFWTEIILDSRTFSLLILLTTSIIIIIGLIPRSDTYVATSEPLNSFIICLICALFTFPCECFLSNGSWFAVDRLLLQFAKIPLLELVLFCLVGMLLWILVICIASFHSLKYFVLPYVLVSVFAAKVYFSAHHLGVVYSLFLFWFILLANDKNRYEIGKVIGYKVRIINKHKILIRNTYRIIFSVCLSVPIIWTICASVNEVRLEYSYGRYAKKILRSFVLDNRNIFCGWEDIISSCSSSTNNKDIYINTDLIGSPVLINAYFSKNICFNLNNGNDSESYMHYRIPSREESEFAVNEWRKKGIPDVIISKPDLELVFGKKVSYRDYTLVDILPVNYIWKTSVMSKRIPVYVRNSLIESYDVKGMSGGLSYLIDGLTITDEMKERFENGESVDEILKPYLDAMFGIDNSDIK